MAHSIIFIMNDTCKLFVVLRTVASWNLNTIVYFRQMNEKGIICKTRNKPGRLNYSILIKILLCLRNIVVNKKIPTTINDKMASPWFDVPIYCLDMLM